MTQLIAAGLAMKRGQLFLVAECLCSSEALQLRISE